MRTTISSFVELSKIMELKNLRQCLAQRQMIAFIFLEIRRAGTLSHSSTCLLAGHATSSSLTNCLQGSSHAGTSPLHWKGQLKSCEIMAEPLCLTSKKLSHPARQSHRVSHCLPVPVVRWKSSTVEKWGVEGRVWHLHPCLPALWLKEVV